MHIALIGSYPPPYGGQSVHISNLKAFINLKGYECTVFNTGSNQQLVSCGVISVRKTLLLLLHLVIRKFDIIHVHVSGYDNYQKICAAALASYIRKRSWIVTFHSGNIKINEARTFIRTTLNFLLRRASKVICVNQIILDTLVSQQIPESKCVIIPAFSLNRVREVYTFNDEIAEFFEDHSPVISCIGMFEPLYGFELAISSIAMLKKEFAEIGLVLISSGGSCEMDVKRKVESHSLQNSVLILKNVPHELCMGILAFSDVFVRPTMYDGDAISVREALALGLPVVASRTGFRPPNTVLFEVGDVKGMVNALKWILSIRRRRKTLMPNILLQDDLNNNLEKILEIYKSVVVNVQRGQRI